MGDKETYGLITGGNVRLFVGGQQVAYAPQCTLTVSDTDDGSTKDEKCNEWKPVRKSWDLECSGVVKPCEGVVDDIMGKNGNEIDAVIQTRPGKMPRKMKKAYRSKCKRDTKWKRKAERHIKRTTYQAKRCRLDVTGNNGESVNAVLSFDRIERTVDGGVRVKGDDLAKITMHKRKGNDTRTIQESSSD